LALLALEKDLDSSAKILTNAFIKPDLVLEKIFEVGKSHPHQLGIGMDPQ
jgi:hypothetical protein